MFGSNNFNFPQSGYTPWYQQPVQQQQQTNTSVVFIQGGDATADSYLVAPNQMVILIDNEAGKMYIKATDASGRLNPLRKFNEDKPISIRQAQADFITRNEFEKRLQEVLNGKNDSTEH